MSYTSGWQKLSSSTSDGSTYVPQHNNGNNGASVGEMTLQTSSMGRSCSWPRNCFRFILYVGVFAVVTLLLGFFVAQQRSATSEFLEGADNAHKQSSYSSSSGEISQQQQQQQQQQQSHHHHDKETMSSNGGDMFKYAEPQLSDLIDKERIPNIVHYIWCEPGYFEFKHYVSVQSAIKFIRPDLVIFHLMSEPVIDPFGYNDWWDRLKRDTQNLIIHEITPSRNCSQDTSLALEIFNNHTRTQGGLYLANGVILSRTIKLKMSTDQNSISFVFPEKTTKSTLLGEVLPAALLLRPSDTDVEIALTTGASQGHCLAVDEFEGVDPATSESWCVFYDDPSTPLYPRDGWQSATTFSKLVRTLAYDTEAPLLPAQTPNTLVPLICHYLWLGGGTMDFMLYLSILSCLNILKADAVLVHGELEPQGALWKELLAMGNPRLAYVYRPQQITMYGTPVKKLPAMSDVLRTDILLKYGGVYTDWDAVWVKPLDPEIRSYDAVVAPDWPSKLKPFPDTLNLGVMLAKPGSAYVKHLQEGMADYADGVGPLEWCFICLRAYKVLEHYPDTVRFEPHLQVMSYLGRYHPVWQPGAGDDLFEGKFDWRTETYAVHWTFPTPKELRSKNGLKKANSTAADIARYILKVSEKTAD